jgi:hypothetical protein
MPTIRASLGLVRARSAGADMSEKPSNTSTGEKHISKGSIHFDEFKMMLDTAEKVTDRRLELNKSNASLCLFVVAGIGTVLGWSHDKRDILPFALVAVTMISILAAAFCVWWWRQVETYKVLNTAKFRVLQEMAPGIVFKEGSGHDVKSFKPFDREWEIMQELKALQHFKGHLALGSSWSELTIPKAFLAIFVIVIVLSAVLFFSRGYATTLIELIGKSP